MLLFFAPIVGIVVYDWRLYKAHVEFLKKSDMPIQLSEWKPSYIEKTKEKMREVEEILKPYLS